MFPVSARFLDVVGGTHRAVVRCTLFTDRRLSLDPVSAGGGLDLPILAGNVKMASTSDVKATLDLTVPGDYWLNVQPYSGDIFVERGVDFGDGTRELVPLGYYRIDSAKQADAPFGPVQITGSDRIAAMQQNRVLFPYQVPDGTTHRTIFERLVNGRATPASAINTAGYAMLATVAVPITWLGYDPDRITVNGGQAVTDSTYDFLAALADDQGCVLRFDESGSLLIDLRDRDPDSPAIYLVAPGQSGNLVTASRETNREGVYNIVSAYGSDVAKPTGYQLSYNDDPNSPLRWNGPFGPAPRYYASPLLGTPDAAAQAAASILSRTTGLPETQALFIVPNPALRPLDMIAAKLDGLPEKHLIDALKIPLADEPVEIDTKTANSDVAPDSPVTPDPNPDQGFTQAQRDQEKAFEITNTAEYSKLEWWLNYANIENIGDGRGLTGGIFGATSATGDMEDLVKNFLVANEPTSPLASYVTGLHTCTLAGEGDPGATNAANTNLGAPYIAAWIAAADDAVMRKAQRDYRDQNYWAPAYAAAIADHLGVLGQAIYYDTYVNHGPGVASSGDGSFEDIRSQVTGASTVTQGKTSNGTGTSLSSSNKTVVSSFTASQTGTLVAGHSRLWVDTGTANVEMVVYADSAGTVGALLATSSTIAITNTAEAQKDFAFSGAQQIAMTSGTVYWVGFTWADPGTNSVNWSRDATAAAASQNSSHGANPFGAATTLSGPIDAFLDVTTGAITETSWLTDFLNKREAVLAGPLFLDDPADGRIHMFRDLLATGNLTLTPPFSWNVYGDPYQIITEPDPRIEGSPGTGGLPGFDNIGQALNIAKGDGFNHFNIGVGFGPGNPFGAAAVHHDYSIDEIADGLSLPGVYELTPDGLVTYTVALDGGRTSTNTKYPRVEHRGLNPDGTKQSFSKGTRAYIKCRSSVPKLPPGKPEVVPCQFHDANDDVAMIHIQNGLVRAKIKGDYIGTLATGWDRSLTDMMIEVTEAGTVNFYWSDLTTPVLVSHAWEGGFSGWYGKMGAYAQSWARSAGDTSSTRGDPPTGPTDNLSDSPIIVKTDPAYFEIWQTGWAKPNRPTIFPPTVPTTPTTPSTGGDDGTQTATVLGWGPIIDGDEFEYVGPPNSAKWDMYDGPGHDGNGIRSPGAFAVGSGVLTCTGDNVNGGTTGGMAFQRESQYWRIEWRVRCYSINPAGSGNRYHPVLIGWPTSDRWPQDGEDDYYECDCDTGKFEQYIHIPGNDGSAQEYTSKDLDIQNWHNIAFERSKSGVTTWIDGVQVSKFTGSYIAMPGTSHPTFQMDNFFGSGMEPAKFEAKWLRIYASPS